MAPLDTGRYIITNSQFKNVAFLADANSLSDICADYQQDRTGEMWNVVLLRNGNYTIQNHSFDSYASCQSVVKPVAGDNIVGADYKQQWNITETDSFNLYVIIPTTNEYVCWYLVDQESGTPITTQDYSRSGKTRWWFTRVKDGEDTDGEGPTGTVGGENKRVIDFPVEQWVATGAFYNSDELYDAPKCHPHTRVAVLDDIMQWVESDSAEQDEFMMWLFGAAGAGKSAIAKRIAELAVEKGLLIGTFFFSRSSPTRNTKDRLIPTLAYQMALSIPATRSHIEDAINQDPTIFKKNIETQIETLLLKPFHSASAQTIPLPKLIIIDGLDECHDSQAQIAIVNAISRSFLKHKLRISCLVASRPEIDLVASFNSKEPLKSVHHRLALDDTYQADDDIRLFLSDKFAEIRCTHRLRSTLPISWPTEESLKMLVKKSSGQFIFAATVVRFVESNRHRPAARLNFILGISPPGALNPFAELDVLYKQILSTVDDVQLTLHVLSLYAGAPNLARWLDKSAELFLSLEDGDIDLALTNLSSIISYDESSGSVKILHASFVDFLSDTRRSHEFYIDMPSTLTDFACCTLQWVKGPDGIRAGDFYLLDSGMVSDRWLPNGELRSAILNFDFDAFITAVIKYLYEDLRGSYFEGALIWAISTWTRIFDDAGFEELEEARSRFRSSFELRLRQYQSDWRLQLLLTLAAAMNFVSHRLSIPRCRCLDILLEMDDHNLHLVDRDALDLRHSDGFFTERTRRLTDITSLDGDRYASAALHCLRFLRNPPKHSENNDSPEIGLIYEEWKAACDFTLEFLPRLLPQAHTSSELVRFMSNHDIDSAVRKDSFVDDVWLLDTHILAFLSRTSVCVNWRIISAIRQALFVTDGETPSRSDDSDAGTDEDEQDMKMTGDEGSLSRSHDSDAASDEEEYRNMTDNLMQGRLDQCCRHVHHNS